MDLLDGSVHLYGPAPAGLAAGDTDRRWVRCFEGASVTVQDAKAFLDRQLNFDSDLWILEVEDTAGRHFLEDALVET